MLTPSSPEDLNLLLRALRFSAEKHTVQRRKSAQKIPYINHPIEVAETLNTVGNITDATVLSAALLHDTVEDTDTTLDELCDLFGQVVADLVAEVTDDKSLPPKERKQQQIIHAASASHGAKQIKIADKICNIKDITHAPPVGWSLERKHAYLQWSQDVMVGLRGANPALETLFDDTFAQAKRLLG